MYALLIILFVRFFVLYRYKLSFTYTLSVFQNGSRCIRILIIIGDRNLFE